jgi:predicted kinase
VTPALIIVSGPPGSGKTTLAHQIARAVGCPAVCRDEIKEGMVYATPGFVGGTGDDLTRRTLPVFFEVIELLLKSGVTTVAEAAFQDHVWRPNLEPLLASADLRIVQCTVSPEVAVERRLRRTAAEPTRRAHPDGHVPEEFRRLALDAPSIWVDTTEGYAPALDELAAFAGG